MHRSLPVGNKVCAARVRKRYEDQRSQRLREMKPLIDTTPPQTTGYKHLKHNWKREEIQAQRHDNIERDDRRMLNKMYEFARKPEYSVPRMNSLPALRTCPGGPAQQREYDRIMQANAQMLGRLRGMQPEIRARNYEESYEKSLDYVRIACEFPPPLLRKKGARASPSRSGLTRLPGSQPQLAVGGRAGSKNEDAMSEVADVGGELRYVLREDRNIMGGMFSVEMATDGSALAVSIYDVEADMGLELLVNEENHRVLHHECNGCYAMIADRLRIEGDQLFVAPLGAAQWIPQPTDLHHETVAVDDEDHGTYDVPGEQLPWDEGTVVAS